MDKNSIIGIILMAAVVFGFTFIQNRQQKEQLELQAHRDSISLAQRQLEAPMTSSSNELTAETLEASAVKENTQDAAIYKDAALESARTAQEQIVTLENDVFELKFTTKGAQPYSVRLKDFKTYDSTDLYLFQPGENEYSVKVFAGQYISTNDFVFNIAARTDSSIVMRLPFEDGGYIEQSYTIDEGKYSVKNRLSFVGMNSIPKNVGSLDIDYLSIIPRMEKGYKNESQYSKLDFYFDGEKKPEEIGRGRSGSKRVESKLNWFAYQQQFFSTIMRAEKGFASGELSVQFLPENNPERNLMRCEAKMRMDFRPGEDVTIPFEFYFGPNHFQTLKSYDQSYETIIPLGGSLVGWFTKFFIIPMFNFLRNYFANFGLIILIMTVIIKIVVLPFTYKSYASSAKMQALKPYIEKINEKYPNTGNQQDQLKKQQATMDLYKRAGVSPMGGCLPTLLTFPILWAMFRFFPASIELRQQRFLWAEDLSGYDSIVDFGGRIPLLGDHLSLFALLMAVVMWAYSKMTMNQNPAANDPNAATMKFMSVWMMPIMMFFICNNLSSGLSYYYLLSQLIAMAEIFIIRKTVDKQKILDRVKASEGKPVQKSKWQLRLEQAQKMQQEQMKNQRRK